MNRAFCALFRDLLLLLWRGWLRRRLWLRTVLRFRRWLLLLLLQILLLAWDCNLRQRLGRFQARNCRLLRYFSGCRIGDADAVTIQRTGQNLRERGTVD